MNAVFLNFVVMIFSLPTFAQSGFNQNGFTSDDQIFERMREMSARMDRMMEETMRSFGSIRGMQDFDQSFVDGITVQNREDQKYKYVDIEGDGLKKESLNIDIKDGMIRISGEVKKVVEQDYQGRKSQSQYISSFQRTIMVPDGVDADNPKFETTENKITIKFPKGKTI